MLPPDPPQVPLQRRQGVHPKMAMVTSVAFEGGGVLGLAYQPAIEALARLGSQVRDFAGTSAGAITALLLALRTPPEEIRTLVATTPWKSFATYMPPALLRLFTTGGWHRIGFAREWIRLRVRSAGSEELTFEELEEVRGTRLYVVGTRYERRGKDGRTSARPFVFSPESSPDVPVLDAVLASMAVPLFWPPVLADGWWHGDGGVAENHPLAVFADRAPETILGVRLDTSREIENEVAEPEPVRPSLRDIVLANASMVRELANRTYVPEALWSRIIRIDVGSQSALDFGLNAVARARLLQAGAAGLEAWLAK